MFLVSQAGNLAHPPIPLQKRAVAKVLGYIFICYITIHLGEFQSAAIG